MLKLLIVIAFLCLTNSLCAQVRGWKQVHVLRLNHVGKEFKYINQDSSVTYLKYIGTVRTRKGNKYKVLTSLWIWGISHKSTSRILIYSNRNKYIGNYYLSTINDRPRSISKNMIVFGNTGRDCDNKLFTYLSFSDGIPSQFFRKCKGKYGDIYSFERG